MSGLVVITIKYSREEKSGLTVIINANPDTSLPLYDVANLLLELPDITKPFDIDVSRYSLNQQLVPRLRSLAGWECFSYKLARILTDIVDDEVFRLKISVSNPLLVHIRQGIHHHGAVESYMIGGETWTG